MTANFVHHTVSRVGRASFLPLVLVLAAALPALQAQTIPNPSFEANATFTDSPGYVSDNTAIIGWTAVPANRAGLNPAGGSNSFANNGVVPNGTRVAFLESVTGVTSTLSTTITGLTVGTSYLVQFRVNQRDLGGPNSRTPVSSYRLNGAAPVSFPANPAVNQEDVHTNPYHTINGIFTATATTAGLEISNNTNGNAAVLLDNFTITAATPIQVANVNNDGPGSLRQALVTAAASPAFNVITFAPALSGQTITLLSEIVINDAGGVVIDATALLAGITLNGGGTNRIFTVALSTLISLRKLTLSRGSNGGYGGAITSQGSLTMAQCTLTDNIAGGDGGAIYNDTGGILTMTQCTLFRNSATENGGAIRNDCIMALTHCTISKNGSVIADSGGGIFNFGILTVTNSIIAGNIPSTQEDIFNAASIGDGSVTRVGANVIQTLTNSPGATDTGPAAISADPRLDALADNGGPTRTMALQKDSPARDASVGSTITSDQRGKPIQGTPPVADIGAFEVQRGTFVLSKTGYSKQESSGSATVTILRTGGFQGAASVKIITTPGTATAADFTAIPVASQTIDFDDGEFLKNVTITTNKDALVEANETFTVTLSSPSAGTTLGSPATAKFTLIDPSAMGDLDTLAPVAPVITSPALGASVNIVNVGGGFTVTGTATDNKGVNRVKVVISGAGIVSQPIEATLAAPDAPNTAWTVDVPFTFPGFGSNTLEVTSSDNAGHDSITVVRTVKLLYSLTVQIAGNGSVTPAGFTPSSFREVGQVVTLTAVPVSSPAPGNIFANWTIASGHTPAQLGILASALEKPTLSFVFPEGLILRANFVPNPYALLGANSLGVSGVEYNGLIHAGSGTAPGLSTEGLFTATVLSTGAFSGKITMDGTVLSMAGTFDHNGKARFGTARSFSLAVSRLGKPSLVVSFTIDIDPTRPRDTIRGTVTATDFQRITTNSFSKVTADRAFYDGLTASTTVPATFVGTLNAPQNYTVVFPSKSPFQTSGVYVNGNPDAVMPSGSFGEGDFIVFKAPLPTGVPAGTVFLLRQVGSVFLLHDVFGSVVPIDDSVDGDFTVGLNPDNHQIEGFDKADYPQGDGYGFLTITKAGVVTISGKLADGTVVTASTKLSVRNIFALFLQLYTKKGYLSGEMELNANQPESDLNAVSNLDWLRPPDTTSHYYPLGWPEIIRLDCMGAKYAATFTSAGSVLRRADGPDADRVSDALAPADTAIGNAALSFVDGLLSGALNRTVSISTANAVTRVPASDTRFTLALVPSTGLFTGTFVHENDEGVAAPLTTPYEGVIYQKGTGAGGYGFFRTRQPIPIDYTGQSGSVTLIGKP